MRRYSELRLPCSTLGRERRATLSMFQAGQPTTALLLLHN